jgi:hypothetical protein
MAEMLSLKPQQRQMSYLCGRCPVRYGLHRGPWKTVWGLVSIKEGKTHGFHTYKEAFIVGRGFWNYHACMELYSWTTILPLRKVINAIIWIWFLSIRLETQYLRDGIAFNKGGKDTRLSYILRSLYCGALFLKLSCMYEIFAPDMYS